MRISDWSSDVCSSDLATYRAAWGNRLGRLHARRLPLLSALLSCAPAGPRRWCGNRGMAQRIAAQPLYPRNTRIQGGREIGRASCRERVCKYGSISVVAVSLKKKKNEEMKHIHS